MDEHIASIFSVEYTSQDTGVKAGGKLKAGRLMLLSVMWL
jgi:hypothetical protein